MGIPISAPVVYEEPFRTSFRANGVGAWLVELVGLLSVGILPLVVGFSMGRFWISEAPFATVPTVNYTQKVMMRAVATDGTEYLWASSDRLKADLAVDIRNMRPYVAHTADDEDSDGNPDIHRFEIAFALRTDATIASFELLPAFDYSFKNDVLHLDMETAPFIRLESPLSSTSPHSGMSASGALVFRALHPLIASDWVRYDVVYKRSFLNEVRDLSDIVNIADLGRKYQQRNETGTFISTADAPTSSGFGTSVSPQFIHGPGAVSTFFVQVEMRVPIATALYRPSFSENLKLAWVQYFCIAYVLFWMYGLVRKFFVTQGLVNTIGEVHSDRS